MRVKMLDLTREYSLNRKEYIEAIEKVFDTGSFILGENVKNFENELAAYNKSRFAVGVGNGTDALLLALKACGIGKGDEVITTPFTFFATAETIIQTGAVPVFCDIELSTYNIDPDRITQLITPRTKAILPVHLYGNPCRMDSIMKIAEDNGLVVIEDCAQSIGSKYKDKNTGTFGACGTFSFFPTKNLGCAGDGGAVVTDSEEIRSTVNMLRKHGSDKKYIHDAIGYNSRLDAVQASILSVKLKHIDRKNTRRREIAGMYNELITAPVRKPVETENGLHVYHQYTIAADKRDALISYLAKNGIDTAVHYPLPLHKQKAMNMDISMEKAEKAALEVLSLPIYPEMSNDEVQYAAETVNGFFS